MELVGMMTRRWWWPHDKLLDLAGDRGGELVHKFYVARNLEVRELEGQDYDGLHNHKTDDGIMMVCTIGDDDGDGKIN